MNSFSPQSEPLLADGQTADPKAPAAAQSGGAAAEGGGTPRMVIRGESFPVGALPDSGERYQQVWKGKHAIQIAHPLPKPDGVPYAAITDWFNCTFPFNSNDRMIFFSRLLDCLGGKFAPITERNAGLNGYLYSYKLGESSAFFAYGGQNGTGFLSLPGEACHLVPDWEAVVYLFRDKLNGRITRWDGAVDDFDGIHGVDFADELYHNDKFNAGGRRPLRRVAGDWPPSDGSGRTLYIGNRKNGKLLRIYEKGMQLGHRWHPWVRWELELHNKSRIVPWDVLLEPGKYVAGAYPNALGWMQEEMQRIRTIKKVGELSYERMIAAAADSYGKLINVMVEVEGSHEKVIERLRRDGIPSRLNTPSLTQFGRE